MVASKINQTDAQEWLESLQQVGEGWYRQVALALKTGAHKALGMDERGFAQSIGQQMIDPRQAIIDLYQDKHSMKRISQVLGISDNTVAMVLAEEGFIEMTPARQRMIDAGTSWGGAVSRDDHGESGAVSRDTDDVIDVEVIEDTDSLYAAIEELEVKVKGEQAKRRREVKELKDKLSDMSQAVLQAKKDAEKAAKAKLTDQERARAAKEADAWAQEQQEKVLAGMAHLLVQAVVSSLEEATEGIVTLLNDGGGAITKDHMNEIENAHVAFTEELNRARMSTLT